MFHKLNMGTYIVDKYRYLAELLNVQTSFRMEHRQPPQREADGISSERLCWIIANMWSRVAK